MKGLIIYIPEEKLATLREILQKKGIDTITYFDVMGRGRLERPSYERIVQGYRTNQSVVPAFVSRLRIELIVEDAKAKKITNVIKQDGNIKGNIFVYDVSESHEL
ncbi:MAG TPA: P-II family nitrogen regulator [Phototrophicaceae bacterium]|nr:P-II family nitrogen regulator [Phototrophicaceae bacterium]